VADHQLGVQHFDIARHLDVAGIDSARALLVQGETLGAIAAHLDGDFLDVQHEVGNVLTHTRQRREFVQDAIDLDRGYSRTLERGQQYTAQRIAKRQAVAALKRFSDDGRDARVATVRNDVQFGRLDEFLPVPLDGHGIVLSNGRSA